MTAIHPSDYHSDLTEDRLNIIARNMLQMVYLTYDTNSTDYDGRWTLGSVIFGRVKKMLELMALENEHPWFGLAKSGMDITPTIGSVPFRFATDDSSLTMSASVVVSSACQCMTDDGMRHDIRHAFAHPNHNEHSRT